MRHEKAVTVLKLARALAMSTEGLTIAQMQAVTGSGRRTVERQRDAVRELFPEMEEIDDPPTRRFRLPRGLGRPFAEAASDGMVLARALSIAQARRRPDVAAAIQGLISPGMTDEEVAEARALKDRFRSWQAVSAATGRSVEDLKRYCET